MTTTDANDKHIRFRVAKYVNRQRATFKKYGFLMETDAKQNIDMQQRYNLPSQDFIMVQCRTKEKRGLTDLTLTSSGDEQEYKRCNIGASPRVRAPTATEDEL